MTFWLATSILLALATVGLAVPFLRRFSGARSEAAQDLALFKEQIKELELEFSKGALTESELAETKREIERRVLSAAKKSGGDEMGTSNDTVRFIGIMLTLGWLSVGSVYLYSVVGRPELAMVAPAAKPPPVEFSLPQPAPAAPVSRTEPRQELADVNTMIERLAARLENEPDDLRGWQMLAWSYQRTNNLSGAVNAYARAAELAPESDELLSLYGEAVTLSNGGVVVPRAREIFTRSLQLNPANARAGYFEGVALEQDGQQQAALEKWLLVLEGAPQETDWLPDLKRRIQETAAAINYDLGDRFDANQTAAASAQSDGNPTAEDIRAASRMAPEDRQAMILSMVDGLAEQLETAPNNPEGWSKLMRSYVVLQDRPKALSALAKARDVFARDAGALAKINATAEMLSLN